MSEQDKYMKMISFALTLLICFSISADQSKTGSLDNKLKLLIPASEPGCSIGVFEKGQALLKKGYGFANLELQVNMSDKNVHRMASVSKQFVAMAVHLLTDQGKIDLDTDVRHYLTGLPDYGHKVTINQIIGHVAGMGDYDMITSDGYGPNYTPPTGALNVKSVSGKPFRLGNEDYLTVQEFHQLVKRLPLVREPQKLWEYSNMGYVLLAILIEEVSGMSLRNFSDTYIFGPLNMKHTFFADDPTEIVTDRAFGYTKNRAGKYINNMTNLFWVGDGGLHTTLGDMLKWDKQFYKPILGSDPDELMRVFMQPNSQLQVNPDGSSESFYANGQVIRESDRGNIAAHSGGWLGANILYTRYTDRQFSSLIMCSNVTINVNEINRAIVDWYFE